MNNNNRTLFAMIIVGPFSYSHVAKKRQTDHMGSQDLDDDDDDNGRFPTLLAKTYNETTTLRI
jgi:hypothetical protein